MAGPWATWSDVLPEDADFQNVYPAFYRSQALILQEILGTLAANASSGTRFWQISGSGLWITQNVLAFNTWPLITQDDVSLPSWGLCFYLYGSPFAVELFYCPPGGTSLTEVFGVNQNGLVSCASIQIGTVPVVGKNLSAYNGATIQEGTSNTVPTSTGFGTGPVTPKQTTSLKIRCSFYATVTTGSDGSFTIYRNSTGVVPTGNSPGSDAIVWGTPPITGTSTWLSYSADFVDTGLAIGTPYYYYIAFQNTAGGAFLTQAVRASISVEE